MEREGKDDNAAGEAAANCATLDVERPANKGKIVLPIELWDWRNQGARVGRKSSTYASSLGNIAELRKELHWPKMARTARPAPRLDSLLLLFNSQVICQRCNVSIHVAVCRCGGPPTAAMGMDHACLR